MNEVHSSGTTIDAIGSIIVPTVSIPPFSTIDQDITNSGLITKIKQLDTLIKTRNFKKGLLQQMFV